MAVVDFELMAKRVDRHQLKRPGDHDPGLVDESVKPTVAELRNGLALAHHTRSHESVT